MVARRPPPNAAVKGAASHPEIKELRRLVEQRTAEVEALERRLAEIEEEGGRFLSAAAHEVKTPLTIIQSYLEIILSDLTEGLSEEQLSFLRIVYDSVLRLRRLILDMVDLAALETGTLQLDLAPAEARNLIEKVAHDIKPIAERAGLGLELEIGPNLPALRLDVERMQEVLERLLDNAVKFTPAGGRLRISARGEDTTVVIEVEDNGIGIPNDRIDEVMEPFTQVHREPGERRQSSGLGLPICRRLVTSFGGSLSMTSARGEGTTVTLRLPVCTNES
jgi:signal transduction histidine kinase